MNGFCSYVMYHILQRQSLCNILKEFHNDTHLQIMQKSVYLWDSRGESGGVGCRGSSQDLSLNLLSVKLVVGNWLHVC